MTDDPWRKPDANAPVPPPPGRSPGYAPLPYASPGAAAYNPYYAQNPYQAPLPKRGGYARLLWILGTVGILVLGGCGVGIYLLAKSVTKNADEVNAFLREVRDQRFAAAYQQLCPGVGMAETEFTGKLQEAATRGHAVTSFDITSSNTSVSNGFSTREAGGTVTFSGGSSTAVVFELGKSNGHLCVASGYAALF